MQKVGSIKSLEALGRERLSRSFFMRDMLYSEISNFYGIPNIPDHPKIAIEAGRQFCEKVLEPLQSQFGRLSIRSAYRSPKVNAFGNENKLGCASNKANHAKHIWDYRDANGNLGALATIIVNSYIPYYEDTKDWRPLAWWIHDHLPYSTMTFYPKLAAFNIGWSEAPLKQISSKFSNEIIPKGNLTKPGMDNHSGDHKENYASWLAYYDTLN